MCVAKCPHLPSWAGQFGLRQDLIEWGLDNQIRCCKTMSFTMKGESRRSKASWPHGRAWSACASSTPGATRQPMPKLPRKATTTSPQARAVCRPRRPTRPPSGAHRDEHGRRIAQRLGRPPPAPPTGEPGALRIAHLGGVWTPARNGLVAALAPLNDHGAAALRHGPGGDQVGADTGGSRANPHPPGGGALAAPPPLGEASLRCARHRGHPYQTPRPLQTQPARPPSSPCQYSAPRAWYVVVLSWWHALGPSGGACLETTQIRWRRQVGDFPRGRSCSRSAQHAADSNLRGSRSTITSPVLPTLCKSPCCVMRPSAPAVEHGPSLAGPNPHLANIGL